MRSIGIVLLILLLPLAGCFGVASACTFVFQSPTAGSHFLYEAEGQIRTYTVNGIGEWPPDAGAPDTQGSLVLPSGSAVELAISAGTEPRLTFNGTTHAAHQLTYWALRPDVRDPLAWSDEWISAETGQVVQASLRAMRVEESFTEHFTSFATFDMPGLLFSSPLWGKHLKPGVGETLPVPASEVTPRSTLSDTTFTWQVDSLMEGPQGCTAIIDLTYSLIGYPGTREATMELQEGIPVPQALTARRSDGAMAFTLTLADHSIGTGPRLPEFVAVGSPADSPTGPPVGRAFPHGTSPGFETALEEAVAFAKQQDEMQQWLDDHPAARLGSVTHLPGEPGSEVRDGWELLWQDGSEHSRLAKVTNRTATMPILEQDGLRYESAPAANPGIATNLEASWMQLPRLVEWYRAHYGSDPDVIHCAAQIGKTGEATCQFGTVEGMGGNYAGNPSSGSFRPGLWISPHRGAIHQDNSYDSASLGLPVSHGLL